MKASTRILVNTLVQYIRTIINMILSLYSSRLVLNILGVEDYGIYSLVAGVVALLSFVTNSLVTSTQRFLSYTQGKGDSNELKYVFRNSLLLHLVFGLLLTLLLETLSPFIFNGFLNIPSDRIDVSKVLYQQVIWMVYLTFIASPYKALLVSRENITYTSIIDVLDGVLKVLLVTGLTYVTSDKLQSYGWIMFSIQCFNLLAYMIYAHVKYEECALPKLKSFSFTYILELSKYTGWIVYSSLVIAVRNQGLAILLNRVIGPVVNAAYGIGAQISAMLAFISTSFNNAIAPQLMSAEGHGSRSHMWLLAKVNSKFSFLLLSMLGIPAIFEMSDLLRLWLGDVPKYSEYFGATFLIMQIVDMLSGGLGLANRAMGNIGRYTLITYSPKLLVLPISWYAIHIGFSVLTVCGVLIFFEILCMLLRIFLLRNEDGFSPLEYINTVIFMPLIPCVISVVICLLTNMLFTGSWSWILTFLIDIPLFLITSYLLALTETEKEFVRDMFRRVMTMYMRVSKK